ncbi:MAG: MarR family transcriptional regulator [Proteobacteria bacterium]|nr:MarR family transcriptional regulator [Pseudomonadota bacterium]
MNDFAHPLHHAHAYRLRRVARLLRRQLDRSLEGFDAGLSSAQFFVMMRLHEADGRIQGELVDPDLDDRANITRLVDALVARNLVVRRRDIEDRRRQRVFLTDAGHALLDGLVPRVVALREQLFGRFAAEDLAALERVLDGLEADLR